MTVFGGRNIYLPNMYNVHSDQKKLITMKGNVKKFLAFQLHQLSLAKLQNYCKLLSRKLVPNIEQNGISLTGQTYAGKTGPT